MDHSAAVEDKFAACALSRRWKEKESTDHQRMFGSFERVSLRNADTYAWQDDIANAVRVSSESLPDDTAVSFSTRRDGEAGWFWFEKPQTFEGYEPFRAILWARSIGVETPILHFTTYGYRHLPAMEALDSVFYHELTRINSIPELRHIEKLKRAGINLRDDNYDNAIRLPFVKFMIAALLWIDQEIIVPTVSSLQRHAKKRVSRMAGNDNQTLKIVLLRRAKHDSPSGQDHEADREWSCRWIVRGHWRQQFYPSTGERRPLWILPYVKGPDDAPLKAPTQTVFAVTR